MPNPSMLLTLLAETSLHPGIGQSVGAIDLPIQRERHTSFPVIQASGLKGSLRDAAEQRYGKSSDIVTAIFGPQAENSEHAGPIRHAREGGHPEVLAGPAENPDHAGALRVYDARLLALPVRSLQQVFVWVTCPLVLTRLKRDVALAGLTTSLQVPDMTVSAEQAQVTDDSLLTDPLVLEDMHVHLEAARIPDPLVTTMNTLAPPQQGTDWTKRLAVIGDDDFAYLATHTTPVAARVQLTPGKTTDTWISPFGKELKGHFWYEETLPPETLLYAVLTGSRPKDGKKDGKQAVSGSADVLQKVKDIFAQDPYLQIGGDETVGQGWCQVAWLGDPS